MIFLSSINLKFTQVARTICQTSDFKASFNWFLGRYCLKDLLTLNLIMETSIAPHSAKRLLENIWSFWGMTLLSLRCKLSSNQLHLFTFITLSTLWSLAEESSSSVDNWAKPIKMFLKVLKIWMAKYVCLRSSSH